jgi:hypothetical protein
MRSILVVGEDGLCCALGQRLVESVLPGWSLAGAIAKGGITKLVPDLQRYAEQAQFSQPLLCVADTDGGCAVDLLKRWRPRHAPADFIFRLAETEAESWVLADRRGFAEYFKVPLTRVPAVCDSLNDPKQIVLNLVRRSGNRLFRQEMISASQPERQGVGYNVHLEAFVRKCWNVEAARTASRSLERAIARLSTLAGRGHVDGW